MIKEDYIKIAKALRKADETATSLAVESGVYLAFLCIVEELENDNPNFNGAKFYQAVYE